MCQGTLQAKRAQDPECEACLAYVKKLQGEYVATAESEGGAVGHEAKEASGA